MTYTRLFLLDLPARVRRRSGSTAKLLAMAAMCVMLSACGKESAIQADPAPPASDPVATVAAVATVSTASSAPVPPPETNSRPTPAPTPNDRVMVTIPGRAAESARAELVACHPTAEGVHVTMEALEEIVERVRCVNRAIDKEPFDPDWRIAYVIRSRLLSTAVSLVRALEGQTAPSSSLTAQQAQSALMDRERLTEVKHTTYLLTASAMRDVTESVAEGVKGMLTARGLVIGDPMPELNVMNVNRRQVGIFEWDVKKVSSDGKLIVARALFDVSSMFLLEGYGLVTTSAEFVPSTDPAAKYESLFEDGCKVRLFVSGSTWTYPCRTYVSGVDGDTAANAGLLALEEKLRKQAQRPNR